MMEAGTALEVDCVIEYCLTQCDGCGEELATCLGPPQCGTEGRRSYRTPGCQTGQHHVVHHPLSGVQAAAQARTNSLDHLVKSLLGAVEASPVSCWGEGPGI